MIITLGRITCIGGKAGQSVKSMCLVSRVIVPKTKYFLCPRRIEAHRHIARHGHFDDLAKSMCPRPRANFTDSTAPSFCGVP